jgi:hypothetical protein
MGSAAQAMELTLTGAQEVPAVQTAATARCDIVVDEDLSVTGFVETSGIEATMAHVHVGAAGTNGPPIIMLAKTTANRWSVPAGFKLSQEQYAQYKAGGLYVNVHSAEHPGGEIRVQLAP